MAAITNPKYNFCTTCGKSYVGMTHNCASSGGSTVSLMADIPIEHKGFVMETKSYLHYFEEAYWHESMGFIQRCKLCGKISKI